MLTLYGIKNCDAVRKARKDLAAQNIPYQFHDFREDGITSAAIARWLGATDLEDLLNKRGTSWRNLPPSDKAKTSRADLTALMVANPTLIKRPVCERGATISVGWGKPAQAIWF